MLQQYQHASTILMEFRIILSFFYTLGNGKILNLANAQIKVNVCQLSKLKFLFPSHVLIPVEGIVYPSYRDVTPGSLPATLASAFHSNILNFIIYSDVTGTLIQTVVCEISIKL